MDFHHARGVLPPEFIGKVPGTLFPDQGQLDRWRDALRRELREAHLPRTIIANL